VRVLLVLLAVLAWPALALACPTCATREGPGAAVLLAVGAMIACPFVIAAVTIRVVRRLERTR
jgi:hypothetical protein